jgi:Galactose-3-O-sulfotransferase
VKRAMLVFIHINKTAGTTFTHILRSSYGLRHCQVEPWQARWTGPSFSPQDLRRLRRLYPRLKSIAGHRVVGYVDLEEPDAEIRYLTFMRDPLKSAASRFQYKVQVSGKRDLVFEEWIQQDWTRNHQTKQIAGVDDVDEAIRVIQEKDIFVGLAEHFDESLMLMKGLVAHDLRIAYKPVNVARDRTLAGALLATESTRQLLTDAQKVDLEVYEYVTQELFPRYRREYGPSLEADVTRFREAQSHSFNEWNRTLSRLKHYMVYQPSLKLYRKLVKPA